MKVLNSVPIFSCLQTILINLAFYLAEATYLVLMSSYFSNSLPISNWNYFIMLSLFDWKNSFKTYRPIALTLVSSFSCAIFKNSIFLSISLNSTVFGFFFVSFLLAYFSKVIFLKTSSLWALAFCRLALWSSAVCLCLVVSIPHKSAVCSCPNVNGAYCVRLCDGHSLSAV